MDAIIYTIYIKIIHRYITYAILVNIFYNIFIYIIYFIYLKWIILKIKLYVVNAMLQ